MFSDVFVCLKCAWNSFILRDSDVNSLNFCHRFAFEAESCHRLHSASLACKRNRMRNFRNKKSIFARRVEYCVIRNSCYRALMCEFRVQMSDLAVCAMPHNKTISSWPIYFACDHQVSLYPILRHVIQTSVWWRTPLSHGFCEQEKYGSHFHSNCIVGSGPWQGINCFNILLRIWDNLKKITAVTQIWNLQSEQTKYDFHALRIRI